MADLINSSKANPCPICGRQKDGDCRISADLVLCHHGSNHHPPEHLKRGEVITGSDGQQWAFTGDTSDSRAATFTLHKPLEPIAAITRKATPRIDLARLPEAKPEPPAHWPNGQSLKYSDTQRVVVVVDGNSKSHIPHHTTASGEQAKGAGNEPWPMWREKAVTEHGIGKWIVETEGEKCAAWVQAGGYVATTQPGHNHTQDGIRARYKRLQQAGIKGIAYLTDNDKTGREKAEKCKAAATEVGLQFCVLHAADVWPGICSGGSIDDAPGSAAERVAAVVSAAQQWKPAQPPTAPGTTKAQPKPKKERKGRKLGHTKAMACFERCVQILAKRERNNLRRRARLLAIAKALGLSACINRQEIAQRVLEAKDEQQGQSFKALTAADRLAMKAPVVRWLIADLVPAGDLTIIGGRPKVGKTRLAVAIAAAVLKGEPFAGFGCIKEPKPVLLITDDQADGDTHQMLQQLKVWDHPLLFWSRHFRLNERDTDQMLETIKANPGALVVMDSLRSVSRSLPAGENDPEMGTYLYDLKAAVIEAGGSLIVIHHCNKAADLVGTDALSGHNAISGAANTVITLHHCPDANGRPDKTNPQRRMFSEGRSGAGCDLVIDRQTGGTYRQVAGFDQWQRQLEEAKKQHKRSEGLTPTQQELRELLEEQPGQAFTRRQLVEAMGLDWGDGRGSDPKRVRDALNRLVELELATKRSAGKELLFSSRDSQKETSPMSPSSPSSDTKGFQGDVQGDRDVSFVSFQSGQGVSVIGADEEPPPPAAKETKETFGVSETSPSDRLQQQQGDEGDVGDASKRTREKKSVITPPTIPGFVDLTPAAVGSGADVMDDDDDPYWGPKPQGAAA